jgi:hypothetical protein
MSVVSFKEFVIAEAKDACYHKVKSRYKIFPSAYASGALVKCRKAGADNWGNKSEESASGDSSLHDWFSKSKSSDGKPGWVQLGGKYAGKPCAKQPGQTTKPKCGSSKMKRELSAKQEKSAFLRKNRKDPNPERSGAPINVATEKKKNMEECWKGYRKDPNDPMKMKNGRQVPNCVPVNEALDIRYSVNHGDDVARKHARGYKEAATAYNDAHAKLASQRRTPTREQENEMMGHYERAQHHHREFKKRMAQLAASNKNEDINEGSAAWQRKEGKNPEGGLNRKGVESYRRENPGSKLQMAVKRRKSFCARMGGMPGPMKDEKGRPTRKALSLRKWNC